MNQDNDLFRDRSFMTSFNEVRESLYKNRNNEPQYNDYLQDQGINLDEFRDKEEDTNMNNDYKQSYIV